MSIRTSPVRLLFCALCLLCLFAPASLWAQEATLIPMANRTTTWLPVVAGGTGASRPHAPNPVPDLPGTSRSDALLLYQQLYLPANSTLPAYTGDVDGCVPGSMGSARQNALLAQVNYFRAMAGVQSVVLDDGLSAQAQNVSLVMAANKTLTHLPSHNLKCFTPLAATAATASNLNLRSNVNASEWPAFPLAPTAIADQMLDVGDQNIDVRHRFWLLHPRLFRVGIGESYAFHSDMRNNPETNQPHQVRLASTYGATYVIDPQVNYWADWSAARDGFVAWPPPGYVPRQVVYPRWSLHFANGLPLGNASVQMWLDNMPISLAVVHRGAEKQTLVWEPLLDLGTLDWSVDHVVRVIVEGVGNQAIAYQVALFDPATMP